jgi:hypothetical protein
LTDGFKLGQNVILECNQIAINSGIDSAFHDYCGCSWLMFLDGVIIMTFLNQFLKILQKRRQFTPLRTTFVAGEGQIGTSLERI